MKTYFFSLDGERQHSALPSLRLGEDKKCPVVADSEPAALRLLEEGYESVYVDGDYPCTALMLLDGFKGVYSPQGVKNSARPTAKADNLPLFDTEELTSVVISPAFSELLPLSLSAEEIECARSELELYLRRHLSGLTYRLTVGDDLCATVTVAGRVEHTVVRRIIDEYGKLRPSLFLHAGMHYRDCGESYELSLSYARIALKQISASHTQRVQVYNRSTGAEQSDRRRILTEIPEALSGGELYVLYQPTVSRDGRYLGSEALIRWTRRDGETVAPAVFIPILEESGFIVTLDMFVCETAAKLQQSLIEKGITPYPVSVNLSSSHINDILFLKNLSLIERKYPEGMKHIRFELTPAANVGSDRLASFVSILHERGYFVYLDDFGNGFSGFDAIATLPVDGIKFDMNVTRSLEGAERARLVLSALVELAHKVGISVVAKGGDSENICALLTDVGVDEMQGYYFSRPLGQNQLIKRFYSSDNAPLLSEAPKSATSGRGSENELLHSVYDCVYCFDGIACAPRRVFSELGFLSLPESFADYISFSQSLCGYLSPDGYAEYDLRSSVSYIESFLSSELSDIHFSLPLLHSGKEGVLSVSLVKPRSVGHTVKNAASDCFYFCMKINTGNSLIAEKRLDTDKMKRDSHTGLFTRRYFLSLIGGIIDNTPQNRDLGMFVFNLDRLTLVNEQYGNLVGDEVVLRFARLLERFFPAGSAIARMGGDEFALVVHGIRDRTHAYRYAERFLEVLRDKPIIEGIGISCRIGVAVLSDTPRTAGDLYSVAKRVLPSNASEIGMFQK